MAKLTKAESTAHAKALEALKQPCLSPDEREQVYNTFHPAATNNVTLGGAFFTPLELAWSFQYYVPSKRRIVDLAAGIGGLSLALLSNIATPPDTEVVCVERNPEYVEVGRRLVPEATWVCGDIFDKALWDGLGPFDWAISNPPFGNIKTTTDLSWLAYRGVADLMAVAVSLEIAEGGTFVLPQMSVPYRYSGRPYYESLEGHSIPARVRSFMKAYPQARFDATSIDTSFAKNDWRGVSPTVEVVCVGKVEA